MSSMMIFHIIEGGGGGGGGGRERVREGGMEEGVWTVVHVVGRAQTELDQSNCTTLHHHT